MEQLANGIYGLLDPTYIGAVIFGSMLFFKITTQVEFIQKYKGYFVFLLAFVFSVVYCVIEIRIGKNPEIADFLFKNFINYAIATNFYDLIVSKIVKLLD